MKTGSIALKTGLLALALACAQSALSQQTASERDSERIERETRHQLVMLPYYSLFDNLEYSVNGDVVTLTGQVTRPALKSDAEAAVKQIEGVTQVINNIEVLPLSPADDKIRRAVYFTLFSQRSPLFRYSWEAVPSIHIIVQGGRVTLTGLVDSETDKNTAGLLAKGVQGVFSVTNNLQVKKD